MFWSKIWFILVAIFGAVAVTLALAMPKPAERTTRRTEQSRLERSCGVAYILLRDDARWRVQLTTQFTRAGLGNALFEASKGQIVSGDAHATAKKLLLNILDSDQFEGIKPDFALLLDRKGRVIVHTGGKGDDYGNSLRGYFLIDDALDGYVRDDLWMQGGTLYRVAGAPVVTDRVPFEFAGAIVLGYALDKEFATKVAESLPSHISFYVDGNAVATSNPVSIDEDVLAHAEKMDPGEPGKCSNPPFEVQAGDATYDVVLARLPGEAGQRGGFYAVYADKTAASGLFGTLGQLKQGDLSFSSFPWIRVAAVFLIMLGIGIVLMIFEADRPIRRLASDAVSLAEGKSERLAEESHKGRFGSIARSVNIAIDKLRREAKSARKDLDELLGPMPNEGGSAAAIGTPSPIPAAGPGGPPPGDFSPPPPSQFRFSDKSAKPAPAQKPAPASDFDLDLPPAPRNVAGDPPAEKKTPVPAADAQTPPPPVSLPGSRKPTPPPIPRAPTKPKPVVEAIDDDILGGVAPRAAIDRDDDIDEKTVVSDRSQKIAADDADSVYFREIFEDFLALKRKCGENTESLTFEKFSNKLRSNRDALIAKHGCKSVKFQVYVKDGKAALKASPVR